MDLKTMHGLLKKSFDYVDSLLRNRFNKRIIFVHVPKCAGSSVNHAIKNQYGVWNKLRKEVIEEIDPKASKKAADLQQLSPIHLRKKLLAYALSQEKLLYINGHLPVDKNILNRFKKEWNFITILRHPVERWYSLYFYNRYKDSDYFSTDLTLEEWISEPVAIRNGYQYITFFSGKNEYNKENINAAKKNLSQFEIVGVLENLPEFKREFYSTFGKQIRIPYKNKSTVPDSIRENIPEALHKKVLEICQPDLEIYNWVKNNLH